MEVKVKQRRRRSTLMEPEPAVREEAADNIQRESRRAVGIMATANNNMAWAEDNHGPHLPTRTSTVQYQLPLKQTAQPHHADKNKTPSLYHPNYSIV
jgi:hypothetical protein